MSELQEIWGQLTDEGQTSEGYVRLRIPSIATCKAYAARNLSSRGSALMFELSTQHLPSGESFPSGAGFEFIASPLTPGRNGRTRLTLEALDNTYGDVFQSLAEDVVLNVAKANSERGAIQALMRRLAKWQAFMKMFGNKGLSLEHRRGLWGEMVTLQWLAEAIGWDLAVAAWKGFNRANHDFQCIGAAIEVKTTAANTPHAFSVSNVRQLDDEGIPSLFLVLHRVEETESGGEALPDIIDRVRASLEFPARRLFDEGLMRLGYISAHKKAYAAPRYVAHGSDWHRVAHGFPRIIGGSVPIGIEDVRYRVAVAACTPFLIPEGVVSSELKSSYGR